jgi:hypothetical protein
VSTVGRRLKRARAALDMHAADLNYQIDSSMFSTDARERPFFAKRLPR